MANEYPKIKRLIMLIARPLQAYVWATSPTASKELNRLNQFSVETGPHAFSGSSIGSALKADQAETTAQYNEFLRQQLRRPEVRNELTTLISVSRNGAAIVPRTRQLLGAAPADGEMARALARSVDLETGIPIFDYLEPYFSYRYANFFELVDQFTCRGTEKIDTFVAHLVDFDQPLADHAGAGTPSSIDEQTTVVSRICQLSRGRLLAFAPYCPFKDVARGGESLANVIRAWSKPGFVGVKLYPPMGFYPYGNGGDLDDALARLYHECTSRDAAVMAHAGSSLCTVSGACEFPGPAGWQQALTYVFSTEKKPLRVDFGHFGGLLGNAGNSTAWPEKFVTLMEAPSGQSAYADLAYASDVLQASNDSRVVGRLSGLLTARSSPLSYRLMYGTDWLMLGLESPWRTYAERMETVIDKVERTTALKGFKGRCFGSNARAWLGLDRSGSLGSHNTVNL